MKLKNKELDLILISNLKKVQSLFSRSKGLLGMKEFPKEEGLWIYPCQSIHTFYMKFSIDCIFLNKNLQVVGLFEEIKPFSIIPPVFLAESVIEVHGGFLKELKMKSLNTTHNTNFNDDFQKQTAIRLGDQLYVDS